MAYFIEYAALCNKGLVRDKNQDNLWCNGFFLKSENVGLMDPLTGTVDTSTMPAFAVFDGMGGEQQGEMAAYIAACNFDAIQRGSDKTETKSFLLNTCKELNKMICLYQAENHIRHMGTTAAILMCGTDAIYICNIGDSRIYQTSGRKITQISRDHVESGDNGKKAPLTQNLGISEDEFIIEPYIAKGAYKKGNRFLICSDGLTDMVTDKQIAAVFKKKMNLLQTTQTLMDMALSNGGVDNITIILCKILKQRKTKTS